MNSCRGQIAEEEEVSGKGRGTIKGEERNNERRERKRVNKNT